MSGATICRDDRRLQEVRDAGKLNGIDYLEVLDDSAPADSPRQQTLLVHLLLSASGLTAQNIVIEGGVRITSIQALWAQPASALSVPPATNSEKTLLSALPNADRVLVVRTNAAGDFSQYTLRIVISPTQPVPLDSFDPELSAIAFSFKVECPNPFDCRTSQECPPAPLPEPVLNYLAKDYGSFRRLLLDRLAVTLPKWTERSPADLGIALVELLAYAADHLSYYQDAVATEAYLGTARQRVSIRRHSRLLDYRLHDGCNARVWVFLKAGVGVDQSVGAGSEILSLWNAPRGSISQKTRDLAVQDGVEVFQTLHDVTIHEAHNEMSLYTWSGNLCCLPRGATKATLLNDKDNIQLASGDAVVFEEVASPETGAAEDANPEHRWVVRLIRVTPRVDPLNQLKVLDIEWKDGDALPFPLCISTELAEQAVPLSGLCVVRGNLVLADHGLFIADEPLDPMGADARFYRPSIKKGPLVSSCPYDQHAASQAASAVLTQDPRLALPIISLKSPSGDWSVIQDLLESPSMARQFVVEIEDDGSARLRFGDGVLGAKPVHDMVASYRVGVETDGNVGAEALAHIVGVPGVADVRNPLPAVGGTVPESIEDARQFAPQAFRTQERAVTEQDYADVAGRHPDVSRALGTLRWTGSWHTMFVTIDRKGGRKIDADFRREISSFLESFRLAGYDLEIEAPQFVPLDIAISVCVEPDYFQSDVASGLTKMFSNRDLPDGTRGFFHPDNFTFGQPVYLSRLVAAAMTVPGVRWVDTNDTSGHPNRFKRWGRAPAGETAAGQISMGRLEIARLDNDPSAPENGKIEFLLDGGR